jgi:Zn-dependent membrane protease YugP
MLLVELIALILVIAGIVVITRGQMWVGIALIAVGILIFLLRDSIVSGANKNALAMSVPFLTAKLRL